MPENETIPYGSAAAPALERAAANPEWYADADANRYRAPDLMLSDKMPTLVKGAGYAREGGNRPLSDDDEIFRRSMKAEVAFRRAIKNGIENPDKVVKGLTPEFAGQFGAFMAASPQNLATQNMINSLNTQLSDVLGKSVTLTSPLTTGFVPFDLVAPSSLSLWGPGTVRRRRKPHCPGNPSTPHGESRSATMPVAA